MPRMLPTIRRLLARLVRTPDPSALTALDGGPDPEHCAWPVVIIPPAHCNQPATAIVTATTTNRHGPPTTYELPVCHEHHLHATATGWHTTARIDNPAAGHPLPPLHEPPDTTHLDLPDGHTIALDTTPLPWLADHPDTPEDDPHA